MKFESSFSSLRVLPDVCQTELAEEPNLFRANFETAMRIGGRATNLFVQNLPKEWREDPGLQIRSKLAWLKKGWFPLHQLLGWHCDMVPPRQDRTGPDYVSFAKELASIGKRQEMETILCVFGDVSLTECITGSFSMPNYPPGHHQQSLFNRHIDLLIEKRVIKSRKVRTGELFRMSFGSFHRDSPAHSEGWRLMLRAVRRSLPPEQTEINSSVDADQWMQVNNYFRPVTAQEMLAFYPYMTEEFYC